MYNRLLEKSEKILKLYEEGVHLNNIADATSSSTVSVKKVLLNNGIDYNKVLKEDYDERISKVIPLYKEGKSQIWLEQNLRLTRKTIRNILKNEESISYRSKADQHNIRYNTEINHNAFDILTSDVLYWIGMLYSDGHIEDREASIELTLHNNDIEHLYKFKDFIKSNRKLTTSKTTNCSRFRFNSEKIRNKLIELGFTSNKSCTIYPHELLKNSRDFWRGVVDGDGGVYDYKKDNLKTSIINQLFLCGTLETIFEFIIFCSANCGIKDKYPSKCVGKNLYQVSYYSQDALKVATLLYENSNYYLERKYKKYLSIKNNTINL